MVQWKSKKGASTNMRQAMARLRQEVLTKSNQRAFGSGGGGASRVLEVNGLAFWAPSSIPKGNTIEARNFFGLNEGDSLYGVLFDEWVESKSHSVNYKPNETVLSKYQQRIRFPRFACMHKEVDIEAEETLSEAWDEDEDGNYFLMASKTYVVVSKRTSVREDLWYVNFERFFDLTSDQFPDFEDLEEAQLVAQAVLRSVVSCPFCEENQAFYVTPHDEREAEKSAASRSSSEAYIPFFALDWLPLIPGEGEKNGKVSYKQINGSALDPMWDPSEKDLAVRRGIQYLKSPLVASSFSNRYRTLENYEQYKAEIYGMCRKSALSGDINTKRKLASIDRVEIADVRDPLSNESILGTILPSYDEFGSDEELRTAASVPYLHEGLTQIYRDVGKEGFSSVVPDEVEYALVENDEGEVDVFILPVIVQECSECGGHEHLYLRDVITEITRDPGGFYSFSLAVPEDGKLVKDWSEVRGTSDGGESVQSLAADFDRALTGEDEDKPVFKYPEHFDDIILTENDAAKFLNLPER